MSGLGGAGFALICLSYAISSRSVASTVPLALGSVLLVSGYGLLSYESIVQCVAAKDEKIQQKSSRTTKIVGHSALALFFWLSYVYPLGLDVEWYDSLAAMGHAMFLMSNYGVEHTSISAAAILLSLYYLVSSIHALAHGGTISYVQAVGRTVAASYYLKSVIDKFSPV
jgi:hypothetical protein